MKSMIGIILSSVIIMAGITLLAEDKPAAPAAKAAASESFVSDTAASVASVEKVIAYYFYTTQRCPSCKKIESFTAEAIDSGFGAELKSNLLEFHPLNIDEDSNKHFIKDYQLYTKSVVVSRQAGDKQVEWKNLTKIWELLNDKEDFKKYIHDEIIAYLPKK